jgi:acetyl esterase
MRPFFLLDGGRWWTLVALLAVSRPVFADQPTNSPSTQSTSNSPARKPSKSLVQELESYFTDTGTTPTNFPDAQTFIYRDLKPELLRLFVVKPDGWRTNDHRPAMIYFFGGAWTRGNATKSIGWARMVAKWGMVGIAPDYRTVERYGATPVESTADARAAMRWVDDHATELGVDTNKIVVGGSSAGGHLALWTAINKVPFGSTPEESPTTKPAALILISAPADTTPAAWDNNPKLLQRFGPHIGDVSPMQNLDTKMPPILMFHGDADKTVPYRIAVALNARLLATSNVCEFVTIPGGGHGIGPDWKDKSRLMVKEFLEKQKILPVTAP